MNFKLFISNHLPKIRKFLIYFGVFLLGVTILDLCCDPIYLAGWEHKWFFRILVEEKEHIYIFFHLLFVIAIFWFQEKNQDIQLKRQKEILDKLHENVNQLAPLKKISEINKTVKDWLFEDQTNILIFYFPYSIHPGFWYDTGVVFTNFINELKTNIDQSYKSKLYFIGPDMENSPFSQSITALTSKLSDEFVRDNISQNVKFYKLFNFDKFTNGTKEKWAKKITDEYKNKLSELERHAADKENNFKVFKIGTESHCSLQSTDSLPSFSFILKVNKNKAEDMIVIDTFNVVAENNLTGFVTDLGIDSIWNKTDGKDNDPEKLLKSPQFRILNNQHAANLFFTTFLETCCYSADFKCLKDDLINLN